MLKNKEHIYRQSGFTLIELIVVIAIIGVLAAIVVVFLGDTKDKSKDTSVKAALNQVRNQAEIYYTANGNYLTICSSDSDTKNPKGIYGMVLGAGKINGYNDVNANDGTPYTLVKCNNIRNNWAAEVQLKSEAGYYCVDYTGKGIVTTNNLININGSPTYTCI